MAFIIVRENTIGVYGEMDTVNGITYTDRDIAQKSLDRLQKSSKFKLTIAVV